MQVFPLRSLLVLVLIPLWPHQLIPWCFTVSYSQAFSIPFDFHSQIFFLLFQYFHHFTTVPWHHCHCKTLPSSPYLCGVNMMWSWHGWGWQPLQTDSQIQLRNRQRIWAHSYAVHQHMVGAIHSYTHTTWLRLWDHVSLVESKWCHYVMVEADSHLKLLPPSILHIYNVFEHIDMLSIGIQQQPWKFFIHTPWLDFEVLGHLWRQHDVNTLFVRLRVTSNCFPHPF
jgi:hypothetical protein